MVEELEITEQVEQQQDPPTKKRALYDAVSKKYNLGSYEEFETKLKDPAKRKALYDHVGKEFELGTFQEFETKLQEPPPPKKKVSTVSFGETYSSPELDSETPSTSEIPTVVDYGDGEPLPNNIVDLSRKATEYSKKTKEIERTDMRGNPIPETIPDESFIGTSKKIIEDLDKQGIKKDFVDAVSELPDEAFNDPNTSKDKLVELYKTNRIKFHQFVNEQKNRIAIKRGAFENQKNANNGIDDIDPNQMAIHVANKYLGTYEEAHPQNLNQLQNIISKKQDIIEHSLIGEERTKALDRVRESYSSYINPTNPDIQAEYEQSPLKNKVDITQYSALKTLQLFDAKKYEQAVNILNTDIQKQYTFKPEFENFQSPVAASPSVTTSDSTLAAKNKGSLSSETIDQQIGKESVLRQLTELGRNNLVTQINSQQYDLEQSFNNTDNPEEKEAIKQQYVLNQGKLDEVSKNASQDNIKFPLTSKLEFDNQVKELVQDAGMGAVEYGTNKFAHGVGVGGESFEDMAVSIFGSEKDKALLGMKRMGESKWFESKTYLPEDYRSTNSPFIMQPSEALKDAAKGITGGKKLSDLSADQKQQLTELVANNQSQIETVTNPKAGKSKNFFSKATLYSNTGFIGEVGAFMYKIMGAKSLGLSGKSAELLTLYNDGYSASYTEKLKEGASAEEANQYGVLHGGVMLLAGTVSSKFDAVKDMLAASKSPISKQILGLGEAGWDAIVNKNKSTISKIANGVSDVVKSNAKMIGTYGVGVSIASDLADKGFFNKDISVSEMADNVKHSAIDMAIGSVGLAGIGFISHAIKNPVTLKDKATIWEIGDNKEFSKQRIDEAVAKNELTQAEGDAKKKVIDNVAYLIDKVPTENSKGKLLTDNEKVKLLYNLILKEKGKEAAKDLPDNQSDKAEHIALVADYANGIILENPTDKQLESRKSTLEKQIEGKDENGKPLLPEKELLKAKAQLEAVTNAIERKENNVEVQAPISTGESIPLKTEEQSRNENGIVVEKPMVIPEPITISPNPTKSEPTVKEETSTVSDVSSGVKPNWDYEGEGDALSGKDGQLAYTQRLLPDWNRESQKGNINPDSKVTYDIVRGRFGGQDNKDVVEAKDENGVTVGLIKLSSNGGIEHLVVAPEFRKKGIATELYNRLKNENPSVDISKTKQRTKDFADWANKLKSETKSDIEKRRQEEIGKIENPSRIANQIKIEAINAKYDAELSAIEVQQSTEVEKPTITEPNKVGEEAETATEEQVKKLITDAAINKKGERAKQLAMEEEAAKHGELGQKVLGDMNGGKEPPPSSADDGGGKKKSLETRLVGSKNIPESAREGIKSEGLQYQPQSQKEAHDIAKSVIDEVGIDEAVLNAQAGKFGGDINTLIQTEALDRLAELSAKETDKVKQREYDIKFAEIGLALGKWEREQAGRGISALNFFYKKSPLGIQLIDNAKRKQDFEEWSKPKNKSWKEAFDEMMKEPEFEAIVKEEVSGKMKEERAAARKARIKKVDDFFDKAKDQFKGGAAYSTIIPPKVITAALEGMKQAYHAGEAVAKIIQDAVDYISKEIGNDNWDKDKFKNEWGEKLKESDGRKKLTDEEVKTRILDRFRKKLKGLTDSQKEEVVIKAHKQIIENGGLDYAEFRDIIAKATGRGEMTPEEAAKLRQLVQETNKVDEAAKAAREERTPESIKRFDDAEISAAKAQRELNTLLYNKPQITKRLTAMLQLNTLGIPALINNPVYNVINQLGLRTPVGAVKSLMDKGISKMAKLFGKEYTPETDVFSLSVQREFFKKLGLGTKESVSQFVTGLNRMDYLQKEVNTQQFRPRTSLIELWKYSQGELKLTKKQVIDKAIQASPPGAMAEIVARTLNLGDKPQRFAAEGAQASAFAKALGLKDIDYDLFINFPREEAYRAYKEKGFSDAEAAKKADYIKETIIKEGERSTFQQDNMLNDVISKVFGGQQSGIGGLIKATTVSPYIKIPANAYWSYYNLINPEVAMLQSMIYGAKAAAKKYGGYKKFIGDKYNTSAAKDINEAKYWFAHGVVGYATRAVIGALVAQGIFRSSNDDKDTKKEREGELFYEQQGTINVTKLWALMNGGNPDKVKNGLVVSNRWFGQFGTIGNTIAKRVEDQTPEQKEKGEEYWSMVFDNLKLSSLEELEQGVFGNTSSLLTALNRGGSTAQSWGVNTLNMFTNIVHPATYSQISRAQLPYYSKAKADKFGDELKNSMLARSSWVRDGIKIPFTNYKLINGAGMPPSKIGIWGDRLDRKDNVPMRMFGFSRSNPDNFAQPIYEDYKKTNDTRFFPSAVKPEIRENGVTIKLPVEDATKFEMLVGQQRKELVAPYINDMANFEGSKKVYSQLSDEEKIDKLRILYDEGYKRGEALFIKENPQYTIPKKSMNEQKEDKKESISNKLFREAVKNRLTYKK